MASLDGVELTEGGKLGAPEASGKDDEVQFPLKCRLHSSCRAEISCSLCGPARGGCAIFFLSGNLQCCVCLLLRNTLFPSSRSKSKSVGFADHVTSTSKSLAELAGVGGGCQPEAVGAISNEETAVRRTQSDTDLLPDSAKVNKLRASHRLPSFPGFIKLSSEHKYDIKELEKEEPDLFRVFGHLEERFGEEYALLVVFVVRNAVELHRAWHMTLLTAKLCEDIKAKFKLRMTWELGVLRLKFRIEDGDYELHRKVPYDYDSEYQDKYMRLGKALVSGSIDVHRALTYQSDIKKGLHTARSGRFLRSHPGRIILYPMVAATCTVIFFGGDWNDAVVAAVCGLATGLVEWGAGQLDRTGAVTLDVLVGLTAGLITGFVYNNPEVFSAQGGHCIETATGSESVELDRAACVAVISSHLDGGAACEAVMGSEDASATVCTYIDDRICMSSILMGTLYWFFYGTAFVIGLLEIICGELETGVTRFIAVSVKTFVLCLGASFGLMLSLDNTRDMWLQQAEQCGLIDLDAVWWRVPLYLLCSASVLGQYRFPVRHYWRGLTVQLAAYETQYQLQKLFALRHDKDNMDYAVSNTAGAVAGVLTASLLSILVENVFHRPYQKRLLGLKNRGDDTLCGQLSYAFFRRQTQCCNCLGIGRRNDEVMAKVAERIKAHQRHANDPDNPDIAADAMFELEQENEHVFFEALVELESHNVWAVLMPAVYQLVPGSMIAKLWFNTLFPPSLENPDYESKNNVFSNLMVISTSLAIGLILGFAIISLARMVCKGRTGRHVLVPW